MVDLADVSLSLFDAARHFVVHPGERPMSHFNCRNCGDADEFGTKSAAKSAGWRDFRTEGRAGPVSGVEYSGLCPNC